ncbi:hypothetical protein, unlikely [Trypanosoma brucei brucei TREU927]|uniref:Uncharacterized protein n=1 Tax=Trypanosoma brucei brucei (strain 927/4 GUTat10.1) TaxID=185431 RepID=Q38FA1_TRYB2|nr:hypothetical protein, unlikely [Trypanosoma brucei brucei TREU927]EAN76519.1 hypothetical protein, unlikely [Trypanosoma brucei brucei TREU927]
MESDAAVAKHKIFAHPSPKLIHFLPSTFLDGTFPVRQGNINNDIIAYKNTDNTLQQMSKQEKLW